jgi:hypothetical protein
MLASSYETVCVKEGPYKCDLLERACGAGWGRGGRGRLSPPPPPETDHCQAHCMARPHIAQRTRLHAKEPKWRQNLPPPALPPVIVHKLFRVKQPETE